MKNQPMVISLILASSLVCLAAKKPVQTVFPIRMYSSTTSSRIGTKSYFSLTPKEQNTAKYTAKTKAVVACNVAAERYKLKYKAPTKDRIKYEKDFIFVQDTNKKISPEFSHITHEYTELLPRPSGKIVPHYFIDFIFHCHGKWIDTNPGRHN